MNRLALLLDRAVARGVTPGGQAWVVDQGRTVVRLPFGRLWPGGPPVRTDTRYDLASLTKPLVTAVRAHQLVDQGILDLNQPLGPGWLPAAPDATAGDLLAHGAGLAAHRPLGLGPHPSFGRIVWEAGRVPAVARPGARALYSDLGFILLGAWVEWAGGVGLARWLRHEGAPLHMADGRTGDPPVPKAAPAAREVPAGRVHDDNARRMGGCAGHAGAFGSADEVAAWVRRLWDDPELVSPAAWKRMQTPSDVPGSTRTLGWDRPSFGPTTSVPGWPARAIGHLGFTGTSLWMLPPRRTAALLLTHRTWFGVNPDPIRALRREFHRTVAEMLGL